MRQILTRPMIDAFAFGHDEYSDGMGRTYAEVDHDESYDVGRTVAEMPPAWRILFRAAPDLLAVLRDADKALASLIVTFHEEAPKCSKGYTFPALTTLNAIRDTIARATGGGA